MTHQQYLAIYEREIKKDSVALAAHTVFRALHREITYRVTQKHENLETLLNWANTVWRYIAAVHSELKDDGFKNMTNLIAEKSGDTEFAMQMKIVLNFTK